MFPWKRQQPPSVPATQAEDQSEHLAHERLNSLINNMADGVLALDQDVNIVIYNGAALNLLDRNDPIGQKPLSEVFHPIDKDGGAVDVNALVKAAATPTVNRDYRLKYGDDSAINLYMSIAPVKLGYGEQGQQGYVVLIRDITHEKSLEEERDEFISVVSHELRTPIAITEGNVSNAMFIADKSGDIASIKKALAEAHDQVIFLADLVNDLSMLSRAERGVMPVDVAPIDIPAFVEELMKSYQKQATECGLNLVSKVAVSPGTTLYSSKLYVREVLQNFITNALKYTESGSVTIAAESNVDGGIKFSVADTGIGISQGDQKRVFEKFFRSGDFRTTKASGTGLGLYVTQKLAKLMNAKITFASELNQGSTFYINVPNLPVQAEPAAPNAPQGAQPSASAPSAAAGQPPA